MSHPTHGTAEDTCCAFLKGDRVKVANGHAFAGLTVTVERYWRNGYFICREDRYGTTCAVSADKLTIVTGTNPHAAANAAMWRS